MFACIDGWFVVVDGENRWLYLCEAILFRILIQGLLQPLAALITATILCPLASFFIICGQMLHASVLLHILHIVSLVR